MAGLASFALGFRFGLRALGSDSPFGPRSNSAPDPNRRAQDMIRFFRFVAAPSSTINPNQAQTLSKEWQPCKLAGRKARRACTVGDLQYGTSGWA